MVLQIIPEDQGYRDQHRAHPCPAGLQQQHGGRNHSGPHHHSHCSLSQGQGYRIECTDAANREDVPFFSLANHRHEENLLNLLIDDHVCRDSCCAAGSHRGSVNPSVTSSRLREFEEAGLALKQMADGCHHLTMRETGKELRRIADEICILYKITL